MPGDIPRGLVEAFNQQRVALFIGAGASVASGMPTWDQLVRELADELGIMPEGGATLGFSPRQLLLIPQYFENSRGRRALTDKIRQLIPRNASRVSPIPGLLANLSCQLYYTTNFDVLLESALEAALRDVDVVSTERDAHDYSRASKCLVRKIHGTRETADSLIITRSDFSQFETLHPVLAEQLQIDLTTTTFLFVGYGLGDPDFNSVYDRAFYRLSPMNRRHYMTVLGCTEHERTDLLNRGLELIDLNSWSDTPGVDSLTSFLQDLREATSDAFHISRFFSNVDREKTMPIVVPSLVNDIEPYVFYPAMDLQVAHAVEEALALIGVSAVVQPDKKTVVSADEFLAQDVILVGSPRGNELTNYVFSRAAADLARGESSPITSQFEPGEIRAFVDPAAGISVRAANPAGGGDGEDHHEYALIARYRNPWAKDRHLFVLAGLWGLGTAVIGDFIKDTPNFRRLPWAGNEAVAVLDIQFNKYDPDNPVYTWDMISTRP